MINRLIQFASIIVLGIFVIPAFAQSHSTGGSIEGQVKDPSGAIIAGATISIKNQQTGFKRDITTDESGNYRALALEVGDYEVSVEASGFALQTVKTQLQVGQTSTIDFSLTVGSGGGEVVTVSNDAAPIVEVARTQQSSTVNERAVKELPVNGRNFLDFVRLTPGVNNDPRSGDISFGGLRGTANSLLIDGSDNNNTFFGQTIGRTGSGRAPYQFSQSSVREFQVNTNSYAAEFGRAGGAIINVVTKSGTNDFHGDAFYFIRDDSLNAAQPFDKAAKRAKPPLRITQFGGTIGGPIVKDKLFFFFNYDGQRRTDPVNVFLNVAPPSDAVSQAVVKQLSPFLTTYDTKFDQDVFMGKVDWQINPSNRYSVRYNRQNFTGTNLENSGTNSIQEHSGNSLVTSDTISNSLTSILRPNLINEMRVLFSRDRQIGTANSENPEAVIQQGGLTVLQLGRNNFSPRETTEKKFQFIDTMSYVHGSHTMKFGIDLNYNRILNFFPGSFGGVYTFTSYADFADGKPTGGYRQAFAGPNTNGPISHPNTNEFSTFIQDEWNINKSLKVYYGLRYDIQLKNRPPVPNLDPQLVARDIRTDRLVQDSNNWAPRVGFAWQPFGNSKTVIRGGYGMFYGRTPSIVTGTAHTQNGISVQQLNFSGANVPTYPQNFVTPPINGTPATPSLYFFAKDYVDPLIHQGSFSVERELTKDLSLSVAWLYVRGLHQTRSRDINLGEPINSTVDVRNSVAVDDKGNPLGTLIGTIVVPRFGARPASHFNRLTQFESTGDSVYHGLAVQLTKRFSQNFQGLVSYTWSHAIDNKPDATSVVVGSSGDDAKMLQDPLNISAERGDGEADVRHRLIASYVWDLAYAKNLTNPVAKAILHGWSLSGIVTVTSGRPFSALAGGDLNNDGNRFTDRSPNISRNTFHTNGFSTVDMRITRTIRFTERFRAELLAEAFNLFNHFNVASVNTNQFTFATINKIPTLSPNAAFGTPISTIGNSAPRNIQLAAKFIF